MLEKQEDFPDHKSASSHHTMEIRVVKPKEIADENPFSIIKAESPNILGIDLFVDDEFKLLLGSQNKGHSIKRLTDIYPANTPLFIDVKTGRDLDNPTKNKINAQKPTYLSELNMLPFDHFKKLIEPPYINQKGFYHVVMWRDGIMVKQIVDDTFYYNQKLQKIVAHPLLEDHAWVYILLKAWAKRNKSYQASQQCKGFEFIKTFSFPDWQYINPSKERQQYLNSRFSKATNNSQFMICKTKSNPDVGLFGFTTDCASFIIRRHYQQYGQIFLIIQPFVHDKWNKSFCSQQNNFPEQTPILQGHEFLIPMTEFLNVFHLIYICQNKYHFPRKKSGMKNSVFIKKDLKIMYEKYTLNVDARDTKAIVLGFDLTEDVYLYKQGKQNQLQIGLNFFFPSINIIDIVNRPRRGEHQLGDLVVPWSKILIAESFESGNADASYVESVKQKILDYGENQIGFASYNPSYQFIAATYFQGYSNEVTYNLNLKPGKYYMRIKIEQKQSEYRCLINATVINGTIKIFDPKLSDKEQFSMLKDCLISKAKKEKKFIIYLNPIKKGSWVICRNQFQTIGYGYIVMQTIKHADNILIVTIDPKKLREHGYEIKGDKKNQNQKKIVIDSEETVLIVLKHDKSWNKGERVWPPPGIEMMKVPKQKSK